MSPRLSITKLEEMKRTQEKIAVLTAYDASFGRACDEAGVDVILIGDSLGNVICGYGSTVPVTMDEMLHHTRAVARGSQRCFLIGDMPYMSYATTEQTLHNAAALMQAGAQMVKLEGGAWLLPSVQALSERGIPVCAHLGLTPQSVDALGGYKVQGREPEAAQKIRADAKAMQQAGARMLVLECVPATLAAQIASEVQMPVIGIGAGVDCDGQVLVLHDMLGITPGKKPKFVRDFMHGQSGGIGAALSDYVQAVRNKTFPAIEHTFN